jgi:hypothetical protein
MAFRRQLDVVDRTLFRQTNYSFAEKKSIRMLEKKKRVYSRIHVCSFCLLLLIAYEKSAQVHSQFLNSENKAQTFFFIQMFSLKLKTNDFAQNLPYKYYRM